MRDSEAVSRCIAPRLALDCSILGWYGEREGFVDVMCLNMAMQLHVLPVWAA